MKQTELPFIERKETKVSDQNKESPLAMVQEDELNRLEKFVERLIDDYQTLKAENNSLQSELKKIKRQNLENQDLVVTLQKDRTLMHERVSGMIGKIEEWEKSLSQADELPGGKGAPQNAGNTSDQTFSLGAD
jgi:peptidoglycan hydrolase CwlO-like protein